MRRGLDILPEVGVIILSKTVTEAANAADGGEDSETDSLFGFKIHTKLRKSCTLDNIHNEVPETTLALKLHDEKNKYLSILRETNYNSRHLSLGEFWIKYKNQIPLLYELALHLLVIPASSAYIERFFSISGIFFNNSQTCCNLFK